MLTCGVGKSQDEEWRLRQSRVEGESPRPFNLGYTVARKTFSEADHLRAVNAEDHPETEIFVINVKYIVIATGDTDELRSRIDANHKKLNFFFSKRNSLIHKVPDTDRYPYQSTIGNPGVQFVNLGVSFKPVTYEISGIGDVRDNEQVTSADIHVFVCDKIANNRKSGEAFIGGNMIVVAKDHVGGPDYPGPSEKYGRGHTLVHEMGHCLGLPHNFDTPCYKYFADLTPQRFPNFYGELGGENGGSKDNKWYACDTTEPHPLHAAEATLICGECGSGPYEAFMNIMDYGDNNTSAYFSEQQAIFMRKFLVSDGNTFIDFEVRDDLTLPEGENDEDSSLGFQWTTGVIVGVAVGAAVALGLLIWLLVWWVRRRKNDVSAQ